jgi:hypothetical protein
MASNQVNPNDVNAMITNDHSPNEENGKSRKRKPGKLGKDKKPKKKPKPSNKRKNIKYVEPFFGFGHMFCS